MAKEKKKKKNRRKMPSLTQTGTKPSPSIYPTAKYKRTDTLRPVSGTNLATARTITFECVTTGGFWKFDENPCFVTAKIKADNNLYVEKPKDADDTRDEMGKLDSQRYYVAEEYALYMNPLLNAASFFDKVEVEINGTPMTMCTLENGNNVYQVLNRAFCTMDIRKAYTKNEYEMLPSKNKKAAADSPDQVHPSYKEAEKLVTNVEKSASETSQQPRGYRFSVDGCFPLSCSPKNLTSLSVLQKKGVVTDAKNNHWTFFRPGTRIKITFHRPNPLGAFLGNLQADAADYNSTTVESSNVKKWLNPTISISEFVLYYKVFDFPDSVSENIFPSDLRYTRDVFHFQMTQLPAGIRDPSVNFTLHKGTKIAYIFFPWQFQIYFDQPQHKGCEFRWTFPANMSKILILCDGKPLKWREGLSGLVHEQAHRGQRDCMAYYEEATQSGIFDNKYEEIFPPPGLPRWKDVLVLEFVEDPVKIDKKIVVYMLYEGTNNLSPEGKFVSCITVKEENIWDRNGKWSVE